MVEQKIMVWMGGMIWDGDQQLSWRLGGKNEIQEDVEFGSPSEDNLLD